MATNPNDKPIRWEYDLHERTFVARGHPLPVPAAGIFDEPYHCVVINVQWLPHFLGAFQVLIEGDSWSGGDDETFRAQQEVMKLISALAQPCNDGGGNVLIPEFRTIEVNERCDQNQWKYTVEPDDAWRDMGTPVCDGENGTPGQDGEDGAPGQDGEDCDCGDPVPTQPPVVVGDDRCQQACNIATGLGTWIKEKFDDTLTLAKAAFEALDIVADVASDLIDAIPVLGAIVDAVVEYAENLGEKDIAALQSVSNNEFKEMVQCKLYEIMADDTGDFTLEYFDQVKDELQGWAVLLPPLGPLLTVIGQTFALFVETIPASEMLRRANVYKNSEANCELCDVECSSNACTNISIVGWFHIGETPAEWSQIGTISSTGWTGEGSIYLDMYTFNAVRAYGEDWHDDSASPHHSGIKYTFPEPCTVTFLTFSTYAANPNNKIGMIGVRYAGTSTYEMIHYGGLGAGAAFAQQWTWEGAAIEIDEAYFFYLDGGGAGTRYINGTGIN